MPPMTVRKRNLPHIDVDGKPYFITACLNGSIPAAGLRKIRAYRTELANRPKPVELTDAQWKLNQHKLVFKLVDQLLDHESPVNHLDDDRLAAIIENAFLHFADERYLLLAFVIMPSHHHWLFHPKEEWSENLSTEPGNRKRTPRETISHSIQSFTGRKCNELLKTNGPFWQHETFDHYSRNDDETLRIVNYIENNPVAAGLCEQPDQFRWSSAWHRKKLGLSPTDPIPKVA